MAYAFEANDVRQEIAYSRSDGALVYWPKAPGVGNVSVTGTPTYSIFKENQTTALVSGSMTVNNVFSVDKLTLTVDASSTTSYERAEDYRLVITYVYSGTTYVRTVRFDVVVEPFSPLISLNDLIDEVADMDQQLTRQGAAMSSARSAEQVASALGVSAWKAVRPRIMSRIRDAGGSRPWLIVNNEEVRYVCAAKAVELAMRAEGGGLESSWTDLGDYYRDEYDARFAGMGELRFSTDTDRDADVTLTGFAVKTATRSW